MLRDRFVFTHSYNIQSLSLYNSFSNSLDISLAHIPGLLSLQQTANTIESKSNIHQPKKISSLVPWGQLPGEIQ